MFAISERGPRAFLGPVFFPLARDVLGALVLAKAEIDGMAHLA